MGQADPAGFLGAVMSGKEIFPVYKQDGEGKVEHVGKVSADPELRVMAANGIDESHRDEFVRHAVNFDDDDNQYLKKVEIEAAAAAWNSPGDSADSDEASEETEGAEEESGEDPSEVDGGSEVEEAPAEDATAEDNSSEETKSESAETKVCPICSHTNTASAVTCESCGFAF